MSEVAALKAHESIGSTAMADREIHLTKNVFVVGAAPTITYNPRDDRHLEQELNRYLDQGPGRALSISGPTKSGKTVLVERRLPRDEAIWIEGQDLDTVDSFWDRIVDWLGLYDLVEVTSQNIEGGGKQVGMTLGVPKLASIDAHKRDDSSSTTGVRHSRTQAITSVARSGLEALDVTVVIDDFHYVTDKAKQGVARAIKSIIPLTTAVLIAVPHEAFEVVRNEPDMGGRLPHLPIESWSDKELKFIAKHGFEALAIDDQIGVGSKLAESSFGAPFLMQDLCYQYALSLGVLQTAEEPVAAVEPPNWTEFFGRIANRTAPVIFDHLLRGPKTRGQRRVARVFKTGGQTDIYGALLYAIAKTSRATVSYQTLARILDRDLEEPITGQQITASLGHMAAVARENRGTGDAGVAYKNDQLYILDPFLLFYLRYGSWTVEKEVEDDLVQEELPKPAV